MVSRIQRMSFDDGPGLRTTVFLQGCHLCCPWCANPETRDGNGMAPFLPIPFDSDDLYHELLKDRAFWGADGGVAFSGGEPLLQAEELAGLCRRLKAAGVHVAVETALMVPMRQVEQLMGWADWWYVDVKALEETAAAHIHGDPKRYRQNVEALASQNANIHFRVPCCEEVVLQKDNWRKLVDFLCEYRRFAVEIFPIHDLAKGKYEKLGMDLPQFIQCDARRMEAIKGELERLGLFVTCMEL